MIKRKKALPRSASPIARGKRPKRTKGIEPKKRSPSEFARIYGSEARVKWVQLSECVCCGVEGTDDYPNANHHTRVGGKGYKADYDTIVSLCPTCHTEHHSGVFKGSKEWWAEKAAETEREWVRLCL